MERSREASGRDASLDEPMAEVEDLIKRFRLEDKPVSPVGLDSDEPALPPVSPPPDAPPSPPKLTSPPSPEIKPVDPAIGGMRPRPGYRATKTFTPPKSTSLETRARAEEVQNAKLVPRIETPVPELLPFPIELEAFLCSAGVPITELLKQHDDDDEVAEKLKQVLNIDSDPSTVQQKSLEAIKAGWVPRLLAQLDSTSCNPHCLLFVLLLTHTHTRQPPLLAAGVPLVCELIRIIARMRWQLEEDTSNGSEGMDVPGYADARAGRAGVPLMRLFMLLRVALLATLGDTQRDVPRVRAQIWRDVFALDPDAHEVSPRHYAEFVDNVMKRYPGALNSVSGVHRLAESLHQAPVADDGPRDRGQLVQSTNPSVMPYIPRSITEACTLLETHATFTPKMIELQLEIDLQREETAREPVQAFFKAPSNEATGCTEGCAEASTEPACAHSAATRLERRLREIPHVDTVFTIYESTLGIQKSFFRVLVDFVMQQTKAHESLAGVRGALGAVALLLRWTDTAHTLMFEHLTALLFDCQFLITANFFCTTYTDVLGVLLEPYEQTGLWHYADVPMQWLPDRALLVLEHFNALNLQTYIHLLAINKSIVAERVQRLVFAASLPMEPYKQLLSVYEKTLWDELLLFLKSQVPFIGKKWRYMNMELISAIYLHCPTTLDENWMSGAGVLKLVQNAPKQEQLLRALVDAFNDRLVDRARLHLREQEHAKPPEKPANHQDSFQEPSQDESQDEPRDIPQDIPRDVPQSGLNQQRE